MTTRSCPSLRRDGQLTPSAPHICAVAKESHAVLHLINFLSASAGVIGETAFMITLCRVLDKSTSSGAQNSARQTLDSQYCKQENTGTTQVASQIFTSYTLSGRYLHSEWRSNSFMC